MTTTTDLTKFTDVDKYLKNLELKTYSLKEIADIIRNITSLCKEGLFVDDYNDKPAQPDRNHPHSSPAPTICVFTKPL